MSVWGGWRVRTSIVKARVEEKKRGLGLGLGFDSSMVGSGMRLGGWEEIDVCQVLRDWQNVGLATIIVKERRSAFPNAVFYGCGG